MDIDKATATRLAKVIKTSALSVALCAAAMALLSAQSQPGAQSVDARLRALYTAEWDWRGQEMGRGANDRFASVDAAAQQRRLEYWTKALATLDTIPFDQLSAEEQVNAQIFRTSLRGLVSDIQYKTYEAPFNSDTFFWTGFTPREGFANAAAYKSYLARLRDVPRYFDEQMVNMRAGLARGYTVPPPSRCSAVTRPSSRTSRATPPIRCSCRSPTSRRTCRLPNRPRFAKRR